MHFELKNFSPVKGKTINIRSENHGSDHVIAVDWAVSMEVPNTFLNKLDSALLPMFYKPAEQEGDAAAAQPQLEGVEEVSSLPLLRSTNVKFPLALNFEFVGYQVTVDRGLGGKSNLVMLEAKVNKFTVDCKEGGTAVVSFRIQATGLNEETRGQLSSYIKGATTAIALKPPEMKQEPIDGTQGHPGAKVPQEGSGEPGNAWPFPKDQKKAKAAPATGNEAGDAFAAAEADGKNKPADEVPPAPKKRGGKKPSLKVVEAA